MPNTRVLLRIVASSVAAAALVLSAATASVAAPHATVAKSDTGWKHTALSKDTGW
jgi:Spy/CpxP family protein refolding chaperone